MTLISANDPHRPRRNKAKVEVGDESGDARPSPMHDLDAAEATVRHVTSLPPKSMADEKIAGRKRGIITDTHPTLATTWVDVGFKNQLVEHGAHLGVNVEVVTKDPQAKGFSVLKRR